MTLVNVVRSIGCRLVKALPNSRHPNECFLSILAGVPSAVDHPLALDEDDSNLTGVSSSNSKSSSGSPGLVIRAFFCYFLLQSNVGQVKAKTNQTLRDIRSFWEEQKKQMSSAPTGNRFAPQAKR